MIDKTSFLILKYIILYWIEVCVCVSGNDPKTMREAHLLKSQNYDQGQHRYIIRKY